MKTPDLDDNETYKFLGVEQSDEIKKKNVMEKVKIELIRRLELLTKTEMNDENLMTAIDGKIKKRCIQRDETKNSLLHGEV